MIRVRTQHLSTMSKVNYNELFRELFPAEWKAFIEKSIRDKGMTLMQVFAGDAAEFVRATNDAPPLKTFCDLMGRYYFPLPDCMVEWEDYTEDEEGVYDYALREIPIMPFFESWEFQEDGHRLAPVFQLLKTLGGETYRHMAEIETTVHRPSYEQCPGFERCPLRAVFALACNDIYRVNQNLLDRLCRKEKSPLKHLSLALRMMEKETGNAWFDYDDEMYGGQTGIAWSIANVRGLKEQYQAANKLFDHWKELNDWLCRDMRRVRDASALWRRAAKLF